MCVGGQPALGDDYAADEALATRYNCTGDAWGAVQEG